MSTSNTTIPTPDLTALPVALRDFAGQVEGLRWTDAAFTSSVMRAAADEIEQQSATIDDLNGDLDTLRSAYRALGRANEALRAAAVTR